MLGECRVLSTTLVAFAAIFLLGPCLTPGTSAQTTPDGMLTDDAVLLPPPSPARTDSVIAQMVAGVSEDSIHAFLEKLTGEVPVELDYGTRTLRTRYSPSEGAEKAAEYLADILEALGYSAEPHYFRFIYSLQGILVQPGSTGLVACHRGRIIRTESGDTWTRVKVGIDTVETNLRDIDLVTGERYVLVGDDGTIVTTEDGGLTWVPRSSGVDTRLDGVDVLASGVGWAVGEEGTILFTADGGETWVGQQSGASSFLRDIAALDEMTAVAVGDEGLILKTLDGGLSWVPVSSGVDSNLNGLVFVGLHGWAVGSGGVIIGSLDSGETWAPESSGTEQDLNGVDFSDASHGWVVGTGGTILHTDDGGLSWSPQESPFHTVTYRAVSAVSDQEGWIVGLGGNIGRTIDQGATWENRSDTIEAGWANVVATKVGTTAPEEEVLLVGHYDSVSEIPWEWAPGADDNGTGTAAVVEAARNMGRHQFHRTLRFICFSGEEEGLIGSDAYAARAYALGTDIVGVFNVDCVGYDDRYLRIMSDDLSGWLGDIAYQMAGTYASDLTAYHWYCPGCSWSDHASFQDRGYSAIVGIEPFDPRPQQHHSTGDTLGLLNMALVANTTRIALATVATLAQVDTTDYTAVEDWELGDDLQLFHPQLTAWPNPFNLTTTVSFSLPAESRVRLRVFDTRGRLVRTLLDQSTSPGPHSAVWDGRDTLGDQVSSGVYFYRMEAANSSATGRIVVLR